MKQTILLSVLALCLSTASFSQGKTKRQIRLEYTLSNLKINAQQKAKLRPLVKSYLDELHEATDAYDDRKDALRTDIKTHTLTDKAADQLLQLKFEADTRETALRRKYAARFKAVVGAKQTWYCFDLLGDKMSKITGEKKEKK